MLQRVPVRQRVTLLAIVPLAGAGLLAVGITYQARAYGLIALGVLVLSAVVAWVLMREVLDGVEYLTKNLDEAQKEALKSAEALRKQAQNKLAETQTRPADDKPRAQPWKGRNILSEMLTGIQERDVELDRYRGNLEQLVEERTLQLQQRNRAMRLVLDHVEQGLATIQLDGTLSTERSRAFDQWFGNAAGDSRNFTEQLARDEHTVQTRLQLAWDQVVDGFLTVEAALDQMPKQLDIAGRRYSFAYNAIQDQDELQGVLLVISDITAEAERLQRDAQQRELIAVFERFMRDRVGFFQFARECESLINSVVSGAVSDTASVMRAIHTVKGNCAAFDVTSVADVAHRLETAIMDRGELPTAEQLRALEAAWRTVSERMQRLAGDAASSKIEITPDELEQVLTAISELTPHDRIAQMLERLKHEPVTNRLRRAAEQAQSLAGRLGKGEIGVQIEVSSDLRLSSERWAPFWAGFVHVVRNAVDHGLERPEQRIAAGKRPIGTLRFGCHVDERHLCIELEDDGRGIDWSRVRERAEKHGLPHATQHDLLEALFTDGVSTANKVTDLSGRGVGLSAAREAARKLGGSVSVLSIPGEGTTFRFMFPRATPNSMPAGAARKTA